jgi:hypothetical protein
VPIVTGLYELEQAMAANGAPRPVKLARRRGGQWVARVWPANMLNVFFPRFIGEVWIRPGSEPTQGEAYRRKAEGAPLHEGRVSLVLGAGNQVSVVALDILHKLVTCDEVVAVKMNPVNDYLGPLLERAFAPLVERGFVAFAYGGAGVGKALVEHPVVESVHLTGSADTYNAIVWGGKDAPVRGGGTRGWLFEAPSAFRLFAGALPLFLSSKSVCNPHTPTPSKTSCARFKKNSASARRRWARRSPPSSATSPLTSSSRGRGRRPTSATTPRASRRGSRRTTGTTASRPRYARRPAVFV